MSTLPSSLMSLPSLDDLSSIGDSLSSAASTAASAAGSAASAAGSAVSTGVQKALFGGLTLSQIVIIVLGLLLIAAGIFSFDKTRELVVSAGKAAGKAAAVA